MIPVILFAVKFVQQVRGTVDDEMLIGEVAGRINAPQQLDEEVTAVAETVEYVCPPCGCTSDVKIFEEPGTCPDCEMVVVSKSKVLNVAIVRWDGVELLDFAGPGEVFAAAKSDDGRSFQVFTVATTKKPIVSQGFLTVKPQYSIKDCPNVDIIVLPGGGISNVCGDKELMAWIQTTVDKSRIALSVCTGTFVLAEQGYLDGLGVTTFHGAIEGLRKRFPKVRVHDDRRFIDNGRTEQKKCLTTCVFH